MNTASSSGLTLGYGTPTLDDPVLDSGSKKVSDISRCLVPLLDALGWRGDQRHLSAALPHLPDQMGMIELQNTMANLRYESRVQSIRQYKIDSRLYPCLFQPTKGHAIVLLAPSDRHHVLAFDGESGEYAQVKRTRQRGNVVLFKPMRKDADSFLRQQPDWFRKVFNRFKTIILHAILITLILSVLALLSPVFIMALYDQILTAGSMKTISYLGVGIGLFILADTGFRYLRSRLFNFVSVRLGSIIGNEVLRRILFLPPAYTETANLGSQVARIKDFESVREFFASPAAVALFELPFLVVLIGGLALIGGSIAFVSIAAIILFAVFGLSVMPFVRRNNAYAAKAGTDRQSFLVEMLANLRAIKNANATRLWLKRYRALSAEASMSTFDGSRLNAMINAFSHSLVMMAGLTTMTVGVFNVLDGSMSQGALMASMILVWRILAPLRTGFGVLTQVGRIKRSITQVDRLMNMPLENKQEATSSIARDLKGGVTFNNVSIRYTKDATPALLGINFSIAPGETVLIVGHDGAGKSTILKLILGLYHPQAGRVLLDDSNIKQMDSEELRGAIGYAPQVNHFFYGTIAQNLRLAAPNASEEDLQDAAWKGQAVDDIMALPDGFNTRIGDHNISKLSHSFRRRLNLSRVFLRKANLLMFDEPEIGLTEWELDNLLASLQMMKGQATHIITTHNPRFFDIADKAIWVEKGRIRMFGPATEVADEYMNEPG